ncbi:MAG: DNA translocase FtsK [Clostridiales bacterium]|nr:DNA translocase FtsK [Clostridiales bacterium]
MSNTKKGGKKSPSKAKKSNQQSKNNFWAVIYFAVGILLLAFTFIEGNSLWHGIHMFLRGMLGISVFILAPLIIYLAIMLAIDEEYQLRRKGISGTILLLLISGSAQVILVGEVAGDGFFDKLGSLYSNGMQIKGGGFLSSVIGWPLLALFGEIGATIIILLFVFVVFMLVSGITLKKLLNWIAFPFKKGYEHSKESAVKRRELKQEQAETGKTTNRNKRSKFKSIAANIQQQPSDTDEPLDMTNPIIASVVNQSHDVADQEEEIPPPTDEDEPLDDIIKKVVTDSHIAADKNKTEKEEIDDGIIIEEDEQTTFIDEKQIQIVYKQPPISLLNPPSPSVVNGNIEQELKQNAENLVDTLKSFGVETRIIGINRGPAVTRYELQPSAGVKISRITGLSDDIALNLATAGVRIEAPIPNKPAVGIEVPNKIVDIVPIREIIDSKEFDESKSKLSVAMGKDIAGNNIIADIAKMPHMLIAGATGSGKSVCINSIIMSLLYNASPEDVRILLIDPKVVELSIYNGIPHLLIPVVTDPRKAAGALGWAVTEMQNRYKTFADNNVRDLAGYNNIAKVHDELETMPQIVIIIDELSDLMMAAPSEVEDSICRLAQMARAAGMHLVIATQRPSVDVITGIIKANIPSRIAFAVSSQVDSRTILDQSGAERLLGRGDMLFYPVGMPKPSRIQACYVSDKEVEKVVDYIKSQVKADYDDSVIEGIETHTPVEKAKVESGGVDSSDEMLGDAIECIIDAGQASTSFIQRRLRLGYARAARIMDEIEAMGIVGPLEGTKREILMTKQQWHEMNLNKDE